MVEPSQCAWARCAAKPNEVCILGFGQGFSFLVTIATLLTLHLPLVDWASLCLLWGLPVNYCGPDGAQALAPSLVKLTQLRSLNLNCEWLW